MIKTFVRPLIQVQIINYFLTLIIPRMDIIDNILQEYNKNQTSVNLSRLEIGDDQFQQFLMQRKDTITSLNLLYNNLTCISILRMKESKWMNLITLKLNDNHIGILGCKYLSNIDASSLKELSLFQNNIYSCGVCHLAKAGWKNITTIDLAYNNISIDGLLHISHSAWSKTIKTIHLNGNELDQNQLHRLLISQLQSFSDLNIRKNNPIELFYKDKFKNIIKEKASIWIKY